MPWREVRTLSLHAFQPYYQVPGISSPPRYLIQDLYGEGSGQVVSKINGASTAASTKRCYSVLGNSELRDDFDVCDCAQVMSLDKEERSKDAYVRFSDYEQKSIPRQLNLLWYDQRVAVERPNQYRSNHIRFYDN